MDGGKQDRNQARQLSDTWLLSPREGQSVRLKPDVLSRGTLAHHHRLQPRHQAGYSESGPLRRQSRRCHRDCSLQNLALRPLQRRPSPRCTDAAPPVTGITPRGATSKGVGAATMPPGPVRRASKPTRLASVGRASPEGYGPCMGRRGQLSRPAANSCRSERCGGSRRDGENGHGASHRGFRSHTHRQHKRPLTRSNGQGPPLCALPARRRRSLTGVTRELGAGYLIDFPARRGRATSPLCRCVGSVGPIRQECRDQPCGALWTP